MLMMMLLLLLQYDEVSCCISIRRVQGGLINLCVYVCMCGSTLRLEERSVCVFCVEFVVFECVIHSVHGFAALILSTFLVFFATETECSTVSVPAERWCKPAVYGVRSTAE